MGIDTIKRRVANRGRIGRTLQLLVALALSVSCSNASVEEPVARRSHALSLVGLVAAYGFEEGSGTAFGDASGNGNVGQISGASWTTSGKYGTALSFDGIDDWATIADAETLRLSEAFTLEAWVRPASLAAEAAVIVKETNQASGYALYARGDTNHPAAVIQGTTTASAPSALPTNTWSHLAATWDGETLSLFVNGDLASSTPFDDGLFLDGLPLRLGGHQLFDHWFTGLMDEVLIFDHARSETEIEGDMNTPIGGPLSGPVAAFGFEEGTGSTVADATGQGHTGTISGAAWESAGRYGSALSFDGVDDLVTIADAANLDFTTQMTISAWVKIASMDGWALVVAKEDTSNVAYALFSSDDTDQPGGYFVTNEAHVEAWGGGPIDLETWHHLATTYDGAFLRSYIDGRLVSSTASAGLIDVTSGPLLIGGSSITGEAVHGVIDEVRVYDRALSSREIGIDASTPVAALSAPSLVAAYGFEENTGSVVADASGADNSGTIAGATWTTGGKYGNALTFDGLDDWVTVAHDASLDLRHTLTLMAWVRPATLGSDWQTILLKEYETEGLSYALYRNNFGDTPPSAYIRQEGVELGVQTASPLAVETWNHLAFTYDSSVMSIYLNGRLVGSRAQGGSVAGSSAPLRIGGNAIWGEFFEGVVDEVRLYEGALTEAQIRTAMTTPIGSGGSGCGSGCDDGNVCNGAEACVANTCEPGTPPTLDDGNVCTTDACHPVSGVTHTPVTAGTSCANATVCDGAETCNASGTCVAGTPPAVDDANPCTTDACHAISGVTHTPVAAGTSCSDLDSCNGLEQCDASAVCQNGTPIDTEDGNPCTEGTCNVATGEVSQAPVPTGTACTPDACSEGECNPAAECVVTSTSVVNDNNPCTVEWCDPELGPRQSTCPSLNASTATTLFGATEWLYTGVNPVQTGVAPGTIVVERAAALQGTVKTRALAPLSGVKVAVVGHPELGSTLTQADGSFILIANGGGDLVVELSRDGFLTTQRRISTAWQEFAAADPIVMVPADPSITAIELDSSEPFQVARGTPQTDSDGTRQGTLLVPEGTTATMHFLDGPSAPLSQMSVRITEFTVGATGRDAMPGPLPPQSHYTYAFEVNADEAVAEGAHAVTFSQPLIHYVENFLDFPAGTVVPVGSYDRVDTAWKTEESGVVFTIISESAGLANIDVTGDGIADTTFGSLGITTDEREQIADLYEPGQSFWRARLRHFTQPYDYNWSIVPPADATPPNGEEPTGPPACTDTCCGPIAAGTGPGSAPGDVPNASVIGCREQLLRETIPIAGTPYALHYASNRVRGRRADYQLEIPLSGPAIPASLSRIELQIDIAGRHFTSTHAPAPNLSVPFEWDGLDSFGREVQGRQRAEVTITYAYPVVYSATSVFSAFGTFILTSDLARNEFYSRSSSQFSLGTFRAEAQGLGGWTLSHVNSYETGSRRLQFGSGARREPEALPVVSKTIVGARNLATTTPVDGGPAVGAAMDSTATTVDSAGRIYSARPAVPTQLWRTNRNGTLTRLAVGEDWGTIAQMDAAPDGSLYLAISDRHVIKKLSAEGTVSTFAGTGVPGFSGDDGAAISAALNTPNSVTVASDGSVYIYDLNERLRRVLPDGTIRTVAGIGHIAAPPTVPAAGTRALDHHIELGRIAAGPDGSIYATARANGITSHLFVLRFDPAGSVTAIAGDGCTAVSCPYQDGNVPLATSFDGLTSIDVDETGTIYVTDAGQTRAVYSNVVQSVTGPCNNCISAPAPDGTSALRFSAESRNILVGPDGLYLHAEPILLTQHDAVYRFSPPLPPMTGSSIVIPSLDGGEFFEFDSAGRHSRTRHALTGANLLAIGYDTNARLSTITNEVNLATTIERNLSGVPTAIVGPFGQRTELEIGADGYLASVENPAGEIVSMTYSTGGLLETFTDARGGTSAMTYDADGRLETDEDAASGTHTLTRTGNTQAWSVDRTTALGRTTTYAADFAADGTNTISTTHPDGTIHSSITTLDGTFDFFAPDGSMATQFEAPEARFGLAAPLISKTVVLPSGLTHASTHTRTYSNLNPQNLLEFTSFFDSRTGDGPRGSSTYTRSTRTFSNLSGANRPSTRIIDTLGRTTRTQTSGIAAVDYFYDTAGRLERTEQSTRITQYAYFASGPAAGYLESVTDPLGVATVYTRDAAGRPLTETRAGATTSYTWDDNGNLATVTPPGKPVHTMTHTPVNLLESYEPPSAGLPLASTAYTYDLDRMLRTESRPTGQQIVRTPDAFGRLDTVTFPGGALDYDYVASNATSGAGKTSAIAGPYGVNLGFTYDGFLNTGITWTGDVTGSVGWQHNTRFAKTLETVTGATGTASTAFGYDNDLLLTCASPTTCTPAGSDALVLTRSSQHGMVTNLSLGNTSEAFTYNTFGELATQTAQYSGSPLVNITYHSSGTAQRDALGRIVQKTEIISGTPKVFNYEYDTLGRLEDVFIDGILDEHFGYDTNGNRTPHFSAASGTTLTPTYDDQDRLLTYGTWTFTYAANGELETKTNTATSDEWIFGYDVLGNLLSVGLPNGDLVEYLVDGAGRRVAKKLNGVVTKQWIYRDALKPVAELDGSGNLVAQFVYGSKSNVPDYVRRGGATYRVVSDHLGSPRYVVNVANASDVPFTANYTAFGSVTGIGLDWMPFGFAGGIYDSDTGLVRFGARDYDPVVGRWTAKDPIRFRGDGPNLFAYATSDPVNFSDPSGLEAIPLPPIVVPACVVAAAICALSDDCRDALSDILFGDDAPPAPLQDTAPRRPKPNLNRCLDACAQGSAGRYEFCRSIPDEARRARCWQAAEETEQVCRNFCFNNFGN